MDTNQIETIFLYDRTESDQKQGVRRMKVRDIMTTDVAAVTPETPVRKVAELLLARRISGVPVIDDSGELVGIVSEGDLISRSARTFDSRREWWLALIAEGTSLPEEFVDYVKTGDKQPVRHVMVSPVITTSEDTPVDEAAQLLETHHIKRMPVLRDGKVVGIVSRSNLLRALAQVPQPAKEDRRKAEPEYAPSANVAAAAPSGPVSASVFRQMMSAFENIKHDREAAARRAAAKDRRQRVEALLNEHIGEARWQTLVLHAREAAEHGDRSYQLLRFPSDLCSDSGRAINVGEPDWHTTLRGEAAELYLYWDRELNPQGFGLRAFVLDYPDGVPGDVGMFLTWGE